MSLGLSKLPRGKNSNSRLLQAQTSLNSSQKGKRVKKACGRCRTKKIKCDARIPCKRCEEDNMICTAPCHKGSEQPRRYSEVLENTQQVLISTVHQLYEMLRTREEWKFGEPEMNGSGQPSIHSIVDKLGFACRDHAFVDDLERCGPPGFPELEDEKEKESRDKKRSKRSAAVACYNQLKRTSSESISDESLSNSNVGALRLTESPSMHCCQPTEGCLEGVLTSNFSPLRCEFNHGLSTLDVDFPTQFEVACLPHEQIIADLNEDAASLIGMGENLALDVLQCEQHSPFSYAAEQSGISPGIPITSSIHQHNTDAKNPESVEASMEPYLSWDAIK